MRKLNISGAIYYCHTKTGKLFLDNKQKLPVPVSYFSNVDKAEISRQLADDKRKKKSGGARKNSGRKPRTTEKQRNRSVMLTDSEYNYLLFKHGGSFSKAVRSLFPVGWEFDK